MVGRAKVLSAMDINGWLSNQCCLPWTVMVGKAISFVCHGHFWMVEQPVVSAMDSFGW